MSTPPFDSLRKTLFSDGKNEDDKKYDEKVTSEWLPYFTYDEVYNDFLMTHRSRYDSFPKLLSSLFMLLDAFIIFLPRLKKIKKGDAPNGKKFSAYAARGI
jgi:hypothetical protein